MNITSSTSLRNDYNRIAALAKETEEPIYITRNGDGDTVLMDLKAFEKREHLLRLRERLLISEKERIAGETMSLDEAAKELEEKFRGKE